MRCTQNEHFSITPRERTVTSGFHHTTRSVFSSRVGLIELLDLSWYLNQLNRRTLWTVVCTMAGTDTNGCGHLVQTFRAMGSSRYRTHRFARRILEHADTSSAGCSNGIRRHSHRVVIMVVGAKPTRSMRNQRIRGGGSLCLCPRVPRCFLRYKPHATSTACTAAVEVKTLPNGGRYR